MAKTKKYSSFRDFYEDEGRKGKPKLNESKKQKDNYKLEAAQEVAILKKKLKGLRWKKDKKLVTQKINQYSRIMKGKFTESLVTKLFS